MVGWIFESGRGGKGSIAVGKRGEGCMQQSDGGGGKVHKCIAWVDGGQEVSNCFMGRLLLEFGPPL